MSQDHALDEGDRWLPAAKAAARVEPVFVPAGCPRMSTNGSRPADTRRHDVNGSTANYQRK